MKRALAVVFASLVAVQLCLLPMAVEGLECPSVTTLPATNITTITATLNGNVNIPITGVPISILMPNGILLASLQYVPFIGSGALVSFKYGTAPGVYTAETPATVALSSGAFQANISGLFPCTTYYARAKVQGMTDLRKFNRYGDGIMGAGVGLDYKNLQRLYNGEDGCPDSDGNEISFQTTGCQIFIGTVAPTGSSFSGTTTTTQPMSLPNLVTQSASLSAKTVTPGTPVTVTADIINKSTVNGNKKVTLYVNGQVETTQGITVNSGGSTQLTFNVSRSEPGDYSVYVDGVPAGSFKVELVRESDCILIFSAALLGLAFLIGMVMLWRRQRAV